MKRYAVLLALFVVIPSAPTAYAQQATPIPIPVQTPILIPFPVPANSCIWANRIFSDGAVFCTGTTGNNAHMQCEVGKWAFRQLQVCNGAPVTDTK